MIKRLLFVVTIATIVVVAGSCDSPDEPAIEEPRANEWIYDGVKTPIVNVAVEVKGGNTYLFLNKNVPENEATQSGIKGKIALMIPTSSMGTEITCSAGASARWAFNLLDTEKNIEIYSNVDNVGSSVGGTLKVEKNGEEYIINGTLNYADGKTLSLYYKGSANALVSVNEWVYDGAKTPIVNVAVEVKGDSTYFFLNKNVPEVEATQSGVKGKVVLMIPTSSMGTEIACSAGASARWAFDLLDTEKNIEIYSNVDNIGSSVGGTLKVEKNGEEYIINGTLNYVDGKTLALYYKGSATAIFSANAWTYDNVKTPIVNAAYEIKGNYIYFYLNKNVPADIESQVVKGKVVLMIPTSSMGTEITCNKGASARWVFNLLDAEKNIEINSNVDSVRTSAGGTLKIEKTGNEYTVDGKLNYVNGKTLSVYYKGPATDLAAFNESVHNGTGSLRWSFDEPMGVPPRTINASCYKLLKYNQGDMYEIFLYTGSAPIPVEEWGLLNPGFSSIHGDVYNIKGVILFIPALYVVEGRVIDLSVTSRFDSFTEHRLPWAIYTTLGNVKVSPNVEISSVVYGFEDKMKLGAALLAYSLAGTIQVTKTGSTWDIILKDINLIDSIDRSGYYFNGEYHGTLECWTNYGFGAPRIWLDEWLLFGYNTPIDSK
jgi:hypothetical protein